MKKKMEPVLKKAIKIQREFSELYNESPVIAINSYNIHLELDFFNELAGLGIITNVKKERDNRNKIFHLKGQTDSGNIIIAVDRGGYKAIKEVKNARRH